MTYIAFLRGINVTGHKIIKMETLRKLFEDLGFKNVRTYIQSGNVLFESNRTGDHRKKIESELKKSLGYDVVSIVRTIPELYEIVKRNPYKNKKLSVGEKLHLTMLESNPAANAAAELVAVESPTDEIRIRNKEVYILCRKGYGVTVFSNNMIEKKLGLKATTRNWNTINKLLTI